jgi:hypothetical protein
MEGDRRRKITFESIITLSILAGTIALSIIAFVFRTNSMASAQSMQETRICKLEGKAEQIPLLQKDIDFIKQMLEKIDKKIK